MENVYADLLSINSSLNLIQMNGRILEGELERVRTTIEDILSHPACIMCGSIQADQLTMLVNFSMVCSVIFYIFIYMCNSRLIIKSHIALSACFGGFGISTLIKTNDEISKYPSQASQSQTAKVYICCGKCFYL